MEADVLEANDVCSLESDRCNFLVPSRLELSHACTGQLLAMRISQRTVALSGGMLFLLFAGHNLIYGSH